MPGAAGVCASSEVLRLAASGGSEVPRCHRLEVLSALQKQGPGCFFTSETETERKSERKLLKERQEGNMGQSSGQKPGFLIPAHRSAPAQLPLWAPASSSSPGIRVLLQIRSFSHILNAQDTCELSSPRVCCLQDLPS